jgi:hypothetical protein
MLVGLRPGAYNRVEQLKGRLWTKARLERLATSILMKIMNIRELQQYNIGHWAQCYKTFFVLNLRFL